MLKLMMCFVLPLYTPNTTHKRQIMNQFVTVFDIENSQVGFAPETTVCCSLALRVCILTVLFVAVQCPGYSASSRVASFSLPSLLCMVLAVAVALAF
jgi:hypothetical protein